MRVAALFTLKVVYSARSGCSMWKAVCSTNGVTASRKRVEHSKIYTIFFNNKDLINGFFFKCFPPIFKRCHAAYFFEYV